MTTQPKGTPSRQPYLFAGALVGAAVGFAATLDLSRDDLLIIGGCAVIGVVVGLIIGQIVGNV